MAAVMTATETNKSRDSGGGDGGSGGGPALTGESQSIGAPSTKDEERVDVLGMVMDDLYGKRLRKRFGTRAFWGTIVGSYWVGKGLFYKISFDDGDVDIISADEAHDDVASAERHRREDPEANKPGMSPTSVEGEGEREVPYREIIRNAKAMKRRREDAAPRRDQRPKGSWDVQLWGRRLYATIVSQDGLVLINEFVRMETGDPGEMEATGKVNPGDVLLAVNGSSCIGKSNIDVSEMIRAAPRPIRLTFKRPGTDATPEGVGGASMGTASTAKSAADQEADYSFDGGSHETGNEDDLSSPTKRHRATAESAPTSESISNASTAEVIEVEPEPPAPAQEVQRQADASLNVHVSIRTPQVQPPTSTVSAVSLAPPTPGSVTTGSPMAPSNQHMQPYVRSQQSGHPHQQPRSSTAVFIPFQAARPNSFPQVPQPMHSAQHYSYQVARQNQAYASRLVPPPGSVSNQAIPLARHHQFYPSSNHYNFQGHQRQQPGLQHHQYHPNMQQYQAYPQSATGRSSMTFGQALEAQLNAARGGVSAQMASVAARSMPSNARFLDTSTRAHQPTANVSLRDVTEERSQQAQPVAPPGSGPDRMQTSNALNHKPQVESRDSDSTPTSPDSAQELSEHPIVVDPSGRATASAPSSPTGHTKFMRALGRVDFSSLGKTSFLNEQKRSFLEKIPDKVVMRSSKNSSTEHMYIHPAYLSKYDRGELIQVTVTQPRLLLTLASLGQYVCISSYVRGRGGERGEIEASGKVLIGDIIVGIGPVELRPYIPPSEVAQVVAELMRPFDVYFRRTHWDMLAC
ncbi:hypothetical protein PINS_up010485 [Pythium insidiosum]|nr:hypothetical protein PINS_up010485 [Pythium insidiosum]